jgi:hypothetical protein
VVHQSVGPSDAAANARYHVGPNHISRDGLPALAYTLFIERVGDILLCNDLEDVTLSQGDRSRPGDENRHYLAVCVGGNFSAEGYHGPEEPSFAQLESVLGLFRRTKEIWGWHNSALHGHYHFGKSACPGRTLRTLIDAIRRDKDWQEPASVSKHDLSTIKGRQGALTSLGYDVGNVDGIWGARSKAALAAFQRDAGIGVDGVFGPATDAAIYAALAAG